jgi:hypothetical protein
MDKMILIALIRLGLPVLFLFGFGAWVERGLDKVN